MDIETEAGRLLTIKGLTLSIAESCTGGLLCSRITDVPGSSAYFVGGVIAYSNKIKMQLLGVAQEALDTHGAVSAQVAIQMARGVKERYGTDIGLGITGIAGPAESPCLQSTVKGMKNLSDEGSTSGNDGNMQKPVGLVYLSLVSTAECRTTPSAEKIICNRYKFIGTDKKSSDAASQRKDIRIQSTQTILEMLLEYLKQVY
ncbi:MAG: nicotinamide-nucleotide amidohydrolase family protein [Candidatus Desantisbacteria bacterium]